MNDDQTFMEHGGDIYTAGKFKGIELIDFSSNINFLGIPKSFIDHIDKALASLSHYPDLKYREIKFHIKEYLKHEIREENIILGNGASEIINIVISTLKKPCIVVPSFSEYEYSASKYSKEIIFSYLNDDFSYNYKDILDKMNDCDGLVIGNPNNPNGGVIDRALFEEIIHYCEDNKKRIIIDEAFIEFAEDHESLTQHSVNFKCLFIIRALTKFFAMPGIRFGYGISSDVAFIQRLIKLQVPWNINSFAEVAIESVLRDRKYIRVSKDTIKYEREYFTKNLQKFKFIDKVYKSHGNFLLLRLRNIEGEEIFQYCISNGILIRRCMNFRGLDNRFIRLAVKSREDNKKLLNVFEQFEHSCFSL